MKHLLIATVAAALFSLPAGAADIRAPAAATVAPAFDIVRAAVTEKDGWLTFSIEVSGEAGSEIPSASGAMLGSSVYAYVWPTSLDSSAVGFSPGEGIVALAVTAHPDFDDTPRYDENKDGDPANDGKGWHSHWVVLAKDGACQAGLKVKDVAPGVDVKMPATAPGVPLFLDSPDLSPALSGARVEVTVRLPESGDAMSFDGVTAGLRVNTKMEAPLLCVSDVFKVASGDLSLPGKVTRD